MKYKLYVLVDPNTRKIRYVGQTSQTVRARLSQHIWHTTSPSQPKHHVNSWIKVLLEAGQKPILRLVCLRETLEEIDVAEIASIARLRAKGYKLCNITSGGDGHYVMAEETREKRRQSSLGEKNPLFGKKHTEETKAYLKKIGTGKPCSPETRAKLSKIFSGPGSPNWGQKRSPEVRAKLLASKAKFKKTYTYINPEGKEITFTGLVKFCDEHGLSAGAIGSLRDGGWWSKGKWFARVSHHGWTYSSLADEKNRKPDQVNDRAHIETSLVAD